MSTRFAPLLVVVSWLAACGGSDDSAGAAQNSEAGRSCYALCDRDLELATDCPSEALGNCKQACDGLIPQLGADCREKAKLAYDCIAEKMTKASCNGGNLPLPQTPPECQTLSSAFASCASS